VPFTLLGKGFLTGKIDENTTFDPTDFRNSVPRFTEDNRKANVGTGSMAGLLCSCCTCKTENEPPLNPGIRSRTGHCRMIPG